MKQVLLSPEEVLSGYEAVSQLYPYIPSMSIWRAWEYAAYRRYDLQEPVLDIGCGDGRFFGFLWPHVKDVVGVDMDPNVADSAVSSGVYREVHVSSAHQLPFPSTSFASAFANCSLEHMDHLSEVLINICSSLRPGGLFLFSVVTDKFLQWTTLPLLLNIIDESGRSEALQADYEKYHHLVNPISLNRWIESLEASGYEVVEYIPILPEMTSRLFLFLDHLWHVHRTGGEVGDVLYPYLMTLPNFPEALQQILSGVLKMERHWSVCSGVVFVVRRNAA